MDLPFYKKLELEYAKFCGAKYAIAVNSGMASLHLALLALGVGKGDEVIMPDFTFAGCGFAVSYCGATPVFVDCADDLNIDVKLIEKKITKKTKVIMGVDIYGRLCDWKEILRIAKKHHLKVIEDACEAQGAVYKSKADITCYSFYENKIIHAEEGGMCTTDNKKYADRINYLKNMAFDSSHSYYHAEIGYNYRMPNSQAKLALQSLKDYPEELKRRKEKEEHYTEILDRDYRKKEGYKNMPKRDAPWVFDFIGAEVNSSSCRPFFKPLSTFPMYGGKCQSPCAEYYSKIGHYLKL